MLDPKIEILSKNQLKIINLFKKHQTFLKDYGFYLVGGTALALQIGHRKSIDFDFVTAKSFNTLSLETDLRKILSDLRVIQVEKNTLSILSTRVKLSFFGGYQYKLLKPLDKTAIFPLASLEDILAMKILAIIHRGGFEVKDYVDLAALLKYKKYELKKILQICRSKFGKEFNLSLAVKAIFYTKDLDSEKIARVKFIPPFKLTLKDIVKTIETLTIKKLAA